MAENKINDTLYRSEAFRLEASNYPTYAIAVIATAMALLSFLIILGNALVIYIYYKHKNLQIPKNYFILSLAIADVLIGIFSVNFYTVYLASGYWPLGAGACDLWLSMDYSCCNASTLNLLAISVERYMSIRHTALHRNKLTRPRLKKIIVGLWVLSFLVWFPVTFAYPYAHGERTIREGECYIQFLYENPAITILTAFINFYGPIIAMATIYILISWTLMVRYKTKYSSREKPGQPYIAPETSSRGESSVGRDVIVSKFENVSAATRDNDNFVIRSPSMSKRLEVVPGIKRKQEIQRQRDYLSHKRAVTLLLLIILAFAITWFPYHLLAVIAPFCVKCIKENWWHFAYIFCYVNSLLNPICYAFGNRHFKKYFKEIFVNVKTILMCEQRDNGDKETYL